jgi:hypothetical protein
LRFSSNPIFIRKESGGRGLFQSASGCSKRSLAECLLIAGSDNVKFEESEVPKLFIILGVVLIAFGLAWLAGERLGLGRLPGDFVIEKGNFRLYLPITTSLLVSLVLSLLLWWLNR